MLPIPIKLTTIADAPFWTDANQIADMHTFEKDGQRITAVIPPDYCNSDRYLKVKETPEEIIEIIRQVAAKQFSDLLVSVIQRIEQEGLGR